MTSVLAIDPGRKNLAMCLVNDDLRIRKWIVTGIDPTPEGVVRGLRDINFETWTAETRQAIIERQPCKNPTMKRLEHYLELACASRDVPVGTIDPKHKLAFAVTTPWWPRRDVNNWTYAERKKLAVETVTEMLATTDQDREWVEYFEASKKKDDLSDAFLHAAAFLKHAGSTVVVASRPNIKPVKPGEVHVKTGRYTQGNLKFLSKGVMSNMDVFVAGAGNIKGFEESCVRHFGNLETAYVHLGGKNISS